ncbi:universal stress protein [Salipiger sp. P9]|mgnify:CR=1 FL=1|uniref:universal stress protein n=1 Tax=Salipiger pentaromativorans TaxID=2943193 RepID=UPI002157FAD6|nr:universal stress protein [Salipiger pentaromativorans]MCR8549610.1 universal stress protein [Salipiger pentaromativorans]
MSSEIFVVAYEGAPDDPGVLDYAITRAKAEDARLLLVHILEWSPYSFLTPQELEERHGRRKQELARAREVVMAPALQKAEAAGVTADGVIRYGQVVELIVEEAKKAEASVIFVGRSGSNSMAARVFGSVPLGLAQIAPVPTVIVP